MPPQKIHPHEDLHRRGDDGTTAGRQRRQVRKDHCAHGCVDVEEPRPARAARATTRRFRLAAAGGPGEGLWADAEWPPHGARERPCGQTWSPRVVSRPRTRDRTTTGRSSRRRSSSCRPDAEGRRPRRRPHCGARAERSACRRAGGSRWALLKRLRPRGQARWRRQASPPRPTTTTQSGVADCDHLHPDRRGAADGRRRRTPVRAGSSPTERRRPELGFIASSGSKAAGRGAGRARGRGTDRLGRGEPDKGRRDAAQGGGRLCGPRGGTPGRHDHSRPRHRSSDPALRPGPSPKARGRRPTSSAVQDDRRRQCWSRSPSWAGDATVTGLDRGARTARPWSWPG